MEVFYILFWVVVFMVTTNIKTHCCWTLDHCILLNIKYILIFRMSALRNANNDLNLGFAGLTASYITKVEQIEH